MTELERAKEALTRESSYWAHGQLAIVWDEINQLRTALAAAERDRDEAKRKVARLMRELDEWERTSTEYH